MRLLMAPTHDPGQVHPLLAGYTASMTGHCPYLGPSMGRELTTWCGYEAGPDDGPELLALLVEEAEQLRSQRNQRGPLVCSNIAVFGPADIPAAQAVLDWPHWIARKLYAPVQIMVGKFWVGEEEDDKAGRSIEPPPVSFFSLRHSVKEKDSRFLSNLPGVATQLAGAYEDGRDVLMSWLGVPMTPETARERYDELRTLFPAERKVTT